MNKEPRYVRFSNIFPKDETDNPAPPICGDYCPPGWDNLVDNLCECIINHVTNNWSHVDGKTIYPPNVVVDQIKEKYGTLRFYYTGGDDVVEGMVRFAEFLSSVTCEVTGEPGELCHRGFWYKTLSSNALKMDTYKGYVTISSEEN